MNRWVMIASDEYGKDLPHEVVARCDLIFKNGEVVKNRFPYSEPLSVVEDYLETQEPLSPENLKVGKMVTYSFPSESLLDSTHLRLGKRYKIICYRVCYNSAWVQLDGLGSKEFNIKCFSEVKE